jgi:hypothetical protein
MLYWLSYHLGFNVMANLFFVSLQFCNSGTLYIVTAAQLVRYQVNSAIFLHSILPPPPFCTYTSSILLKNQDDELAKNSSPGALRQYQCININSGHIYSACIFSFTSPKAYLTSLFFFERLLPPVEAPRLPALPPMLFAARLIDY